MTQFAPNAIPELPTAYTGDDFATDWNAFLAAYKTGQIGETRPAWADAGFLWVKDNGDGTMSLMVWDGSTGRSVALVPAGATAAEWRAALGIYKPTISEQVATPRLGGTGEGPLGDGVIYSPGSATSRLRVRAMCYGSVSLTSGNDPRGQVILRHFDGTNYVGGAAEYVGELNPTGVAAPVEDYYAIPLVRDLGVADRRSDNGTWTVRLYGESLSGTTLSATRTVFEFQEYEP